MTAVALTIAGSDPSGGAGLQADLKTFQQHGVYGMSAVTLLTVQNTVGVTAVETLDPALVLAQIDAVVGDIPPAAAKTGALGSAPTIRAVAERAASFDFPLVVDPVMVSKHGDPLIDEDAIEALKSVLLPRAFVTTPNLAEASRLTGLSLDDEAAAVRAAATIGERGVPYVLVKGVPDAARGDADAAAQPVIDLLWAEGDVIRFEVDRIGTTSPHGSGCVLSAAIAAQLALGFEPVEAIAVAFAFVQTAIATRPDLGRGHGPTDLLTVAAPGPDDELRRELGYLLAADLGEE